MSWFGVTFASVWTTSIESKAFAIGDSTQDNYE